MHGCCNPVSLHPHPLAWDEADVDAADGSAFGCILYDMQPVFLLLHFLILVQIVSFSIEMN